MKRLLIVILLVSLGWFAYWFIGAESARAAYASWFDARRAEGWQADYSALHMRGFPNRFDATLEEVALVDPATGLGWVAPFFQIFALTYKPNHIIAVWPESHQILTPNQQVDIKSDDMKASAVVAPDTDLALLRANFAAEALRLQSNLDWSLSAESVRLALSRHESTDSSYDLALQGSAVAPPTALRTAVLPATMSALDLDMTAQFDRPWDLRALEERRPQPTAITLRTAHAKWGELEAKAAGDVTVDAAGALDGTLTLRLAKWREMLAVARDSGQFSAAALDATEQGLSLLAGLTGNNADNIDVTLTFRGGIAFAGILPLGPAPRLQLR
ncbi:DUF2125 domain-containing protein [Cognatishimia sp. SS12]|uniref:DUF2125 domain-containing protein n=1 Tax=Cognatishimia sp. SS12 TaxID=2979465 RepID=UPI0023307932|nr:DUF2125 domain-containing protein [Cognatishimia sp. SS12]MDC0738862.1 DUF2125 domain-containing protein [Cognatishimia sp. SS12]